MLSGVQTLRTSGAPANMRAGRLAVDPATGSLWVGRGMATAPLLLLSEAIRDDRYLRLSGGTLTNGLSFGLAAASDATDLSRHVDLYGADYGFNARNATLNLVAPTAATYVFVSPDGVKATVSAAGAGVPLTTTVITREKGDARYLRLVGGAYSEPAGSSIYFAVNGIQSARIDPAGASTPGANTVITREKGDSRYALVGGNAAQDFNAGRMFLSTPGTPAAPTLRLAGAGAAGISSFDDGNGVSFSVGGVTAGRIEPVGTAAPSAQSVLTREKGDARYAVAAGGPFLPLTGGTLTNGLSFGLGTVLDATDLSRHVDLYGADYGLSITPNTLNLVAPTATNYAFVSPDGVKATVGGAGTNAPLTTTVITREKGDARYLRLVGDVMDGPISIDANPTVDSHLARKGYVDAQVASAVSGLLSTASGDTRYLRTIGGALSGGLVLPYGGTASLANLKFGAANNGIFMPSYGQPIHFTISGAIAGRLDSGGGLGASTSIVTRAAGDGRYAPTGRSISAGGGLTGGGTLAADRTISHADTSSVNDRSTVVGSALSAMTFDTYGHVTSYAAQNFDVRYAAIADAWPGVYTGSAEDNTNYPVGTTLLVDTRGLARNSLQTVRLSPVASKYTTSGTGAILTGTWRMRGDTIYSDHGQMVQRVA